MAAAARLPGSVSATCVGRSIDRIEGRAAAVTHTPKKRDEGSVMVFNCNERVSTCQPPPVQARRWTACLCEGVDLGSVLHEYAVDNMHGRAFQGKGANTRVSRMVRATKRGRSIAQSNVDVGRTSAPHIRTCRRAPLLAGTTIKSGVRPMDF